MNTILMLLEIYAAMALAAVMGAAIASIGERMREALQYRHIAHEQEPKDLAARAFPLLIYAVSPRSRPILEKLLIQLADEQRAPER